MFTGKGLHALLPVGRQMYVDDVILQGGHGVGVVERLVALVAEQLPPLALVMVGLVGKVLTQRTERPTNGTSDRTQRPFIRPK